MNKLKEIIKHHFNDLKSIRISMIWLYSISYLIISFYCIFKYESAATTVITSNAALVSIIFSGYIFSKTFKRGEENNDTSR
ncbi:MAG: hypothetical protein QXY18_01055 [Nitrososphaerota archaeon]